MRYDMPEVIVDLPRGGSHLRNRKSRLRLSGKEVNSWTEENYEAHDGGPNRLSMSPGDRNRGRLSSKSSGDRRNPLRRFLRSRVGRLWNDVHSEMSVELDNRAFTSGHNFWLLVNQMVTTRCHIGTDGKVYASVGWQRFMGVWGFYVHPGSGILCFRELPARPRAEKKSAFTLALKEYGLIEMAYNPSGIWTEKPTNLESFRIVSDLIVLEKKPGGWFIHTYSHHQPDDVVEWRYSSIQSRSLPVLFKNSSIPSLYRVSSRQMGKKDLKRYSQEITGNPF